MTQDYKRKELSHAEQHQIDEIPGVAVATDAVGHSEGLQPDGPPRKYPGPSQDLAVTTLLRAFAA